MVKSSPCPKHMDKYCTVVAYETVHKSKEAIKGYVIYTFTTLNSHLQRRIVQNEILLSEKCPAWKLNDRPEDGRND